MSTTTQPDIERHRAATEFVLRLGRALDQAGYPADQLTEVLSIAAERLGLPNIEIYATATVLQIAIGPLNQQRTYLLNVQPGSMNLGQLTRLDAVATEVIEGRMSPVEGIEQINAIDAARSPYGPVATVIAYALASGAFARILGGGLREIAAATLVGAVIGLLALVSARLPRVERVFEPLAAFAASCLAGVLAAHVFPIASSLVTLAGLVVLVPGLSLTIALQELSTRHLTTGTARLSAALITFLGIIFGVALGSQVSTYLAGQAGIVAPVALPNWTALIAAVVSGLAFTIILQVEPRDTGWVLLASLVAFAAGRAGTHVLGPLGGFVGALVVGVTGNIFSAIRKRPAVVMLVPGLLMLVPGSVGYLSLAALLRADTTTGVQGAFQLFLTGAALVYGLLFANLVAPPQRLLASLENTYRQFFEKQGR